MMTEMKLPACYAVIDENEMTYLDGGATIAAVSYTHLTLPTKA